MEITITKGSGQDAIAVRRTDGSGGNFRFPHKGPTVHDAIHFFVERELGCTRGFWGLVAAGARPDDVGAMAHEGGHASAKRARNPDPEIVELVQAERLVECFEAEAWSGSSDDAGLLAMAEAGWRASHVPPIPLTAGVLGVIRCAIAAFHEDWARRSAGETIDLTWNEAA